MFLLLVHYERRINAFNPLANLVLCCKQEVDWMDVIGGRPVSCLVLFPLSDADVRMLLVGLSL